MTDAARSADPAVPAVPAEGGSSWTFRVIPRGLAAAATALLATLALATCGSEPTPEQVARDWASAVCNNDADRAIELSGGRLATLDRADWEDMLADFEADGCTDERVSVTPFATAESVAEYDLHVDLDGIYYDWRVSVNRLDAEGWVVTGIAWA